MFNEKIAQVNKLIMSFFYVIDFEIIFSDIDAIITEMRQGS